MGIGAVALAAVALFIPTGSPVSARSAGTITFRGTASTPPFTYPTHGPARSGTITITSQTCADTGTNINKPTKAPATAGTTCSFNASGSIGANAAGIGGYCGASGGTISGTFTDSQGQTYTFTAQFNTAGGTFEFTGTARKISTGQTGPFAGGGEAAPDATQGQSCTTGATSFIIAGEATYSIA